MDMNEIRSKLRGNTVENEFDIGSIGLAPMIGVEAPPLNPIDHHSFMASFRETGFLPALEGSGYHRHFVPFPAKRPGQSGQVRLRSTPAFGWIAVHTHQDAHG